MFKTRSIILLSLGLLCSQLQARDHQCERKTDYAKVALRVCQVAGAAVIIQYVGSRVHSGIQGYAHSIYLKGPWQSTEQKINTTCSNILNNTNFFLSFTAAASCSAAFVGAAEYAARAKKIV